MQLQLASRKKAKIKMALQGPSGSGKTYSALLLGFGLSGDWKKLAVIDSENHSAQLYAHLGTYNVLNISAPFTPEKYIQAIEVCEKSGMEVIIIDSQSQEWENMLDYHSSLMGNSFTNWSKVNPRHNEFVQKYLQSPCHIISTIRSKQEYVLSEKNGKMVPEKVGLAGIQRPNSEYEFTLVFDLDMKNHATVSKDRTGLFNGRPEQKLTAETGKQIRDWCNSGADITAIDVSERINDCRSIQQLLELFNQYPQFKETLKPEFEQHKRKLIVDQGVNNILSLPKISSNGTGSK